MAKDKQNAAAKTRKRREPSGPTTGKRPSGGQPPNLPAGESLPLPRWPLALAAAVWGGWLVFLVVMMVVRIRSTAG